MLILERVERRIKSGVTLKVVIQTKSKINYFRVSSHIILAIISLVACGLGVIYADGDFREGASIGSGYIALVFLAITLLIGPLNLLRKRRNPVNINFRRDVGIWSGYMGVLHTILGLQVYENGDIARYFFSVQPNSFSPRLDVFGISNYLGVIATIIITVLLVTSNQISLQKLKGKTWKLIQRFNYLLGFVVLVHTFGYQIYTQRESVFIWAVIAVSVVTIGAQIGGMLVMRSRLAQRKAVNAEPAMPVLTAVPVMDARMARRRFITVAGVAFIGGIAAGLGSSQIFANGTKKEVQAATVPTVAPTSTATNAPATVPTVTATASTPARNNQGSAVATTAPTATPNASASANPVTVSGDVLAMAANLPKGSAVKFVVPGTGESAFLVHRKDDTLKAFSASCTHRPYDLTYNSSSETLYCALHNVAFNTTNGAPDRRPASKPLPSFKVELNAQGQIVYVQ